MTGITRCRVTVGIRFGRGGTSSVMIGDPFDFIRTDMIGTCQIADDQFNWMKRSATIERETCLPVSGLERNTAISFPIR